MLGIMTCWRAPVKCDSEDLKVVRSHKSIFGIENVRLTCFSVGQIWKQKQANLMRKTRRDFLYAYLDKLD